MPAKAGLSSYLPRVSRAAAHDAVFVIASPMPSRTHRPICHDNKMLEGRFAVPMTELRSSKAGSRPAK